VGDNGNGTMTVTPFDLNTASFVFVNTYGSACSATLTAAKTARNGTLADGQFSFAVQDEDGVIVATATNDANGNIVFPDIHYTSADVGTHDYTMFETSPGGSGWSVDPTVYNVIVTVVDDGYGNLTATITYPGDVPPTFVNTYNSIGSIVLTASKAVVGGTLSAGQFSFAVYDGGTVIATATNDANGDIIFPAILYNLSDAGKTYVYSIQETSPGGNGWTTDPNPYNVSVVVTDNGDGTIKATPTYHAGGIEFVNIYEAEGSVTLQATKIAKGGDPLAAGQFAFAVLDQSGETVATGTNDAAGDIEFTPIYYDNYDVGTYNYTIVETSEDGGGWTVSTSQIAVSVSVTDNGDGTLTIVPTYPAGGVVFTNTYAAWGSFTLTGTKNVNGGTLVAGQFSFAVQENGVTVATGTNDASGNITFTKIDYTTNDAGPHYYIVTETTPNGNGWTTDISQIPVTVDVEDDGDGDLIATASYPEGDVVFTNTYASSGSIALTATKTAVGNTLTAGQFTFAVLDQAGVTVATGTNGVPVPPGNTQAGITFTPITFSNTTVGAGRYVYTIVETSAATPGWTTDTSEIPVTVDVADDGNGNLIATPTYPAGGVVFNNTYASAGSFSITATKTTFGRALTAGQFAFAVRDQSGNTVATGTNDAAGDITFTPINYTNYTAGTHRYVVVETSVSGAGWTTSTAQIPVWVTVTDNGDSTLSITQVNPLGGVVFTNSYESSGSVTLSATKTATGRTLSANQFSFAVQENGVTVATGTNNAAGNITFTPINYITGDAGTHNYTIIETSTGGNGWAADSSTFSVTVQVTDNGNGTLTATPTYPAGGVSFANAYSATGSVILTATKIAVGNTLTDGQFDFAVRENGTTVATGTNDAAGIITFSPIDYTTGGAGTYNYTIVETSTDGSGWTVSTSQISVRVVVVDDGNGNMVATPAYPAGGVVFTNTYAAESPFTMTATKIAIGGPFSAGEFKFAVLDESGNTVATGTNDAAGDITFTTINYTNNDVGIHRYVVIETTPSDSNWTTSSVRIPVWITVIDNNDGTLTILQETPFGDLIFTDIYESSGFVVLTATKTAVGAPLSSGLFSFAVVDKSGSSDVIVATGTNDANGIITFTPIHYGIGDVGDHTYTVVETSPTALPGTAGWMTDATLYVITVTVVENDLEGTITATQTSPASPVEFINNYYPAMNFTVTKTVDKPAVFVGETVTWSVVAAIPYGIEKCQDFTVVDSLDPDLLYVTDSLTVTGLSSATAATGVDISSSSTAVINSNTLTVEFSSASGLSTLSGYSYALIKFSTVVGDNILNYTDYTLTNNVSVTFTDNRNRPDTITTTNDPTVHTAAIMINKIDSATRTGVNVNGAEFQIASSAANAKAGNFLRQAADGSIVDVGDTGYDTAAVWAVTTANGTATTNATALFAGVKDYTLNSRGAKVYQSYWLVETAAPAGYKLPGGSIRVNFTANNSTLATSYTVNVTVRNGNNARGSGAQGSGAADNSGNGFTGDNSNMLLWVLLLSASLLGLTCILLWRARQRIRRNE